MTETSQPNPVAPPSTGFAIPVSPKVLFSALGFLAAGGAGSVGYEAFAEPRAPQVLVQKLDSQERKLEELDVKVELMAVHLVEVKADLKAERGAHDRFDESLKELRIRVRALETE